MANQKLTYEELEFKVKTLEDNLQLYQTILDYSNDWEVFTDYNGKLVYSRSTFENIIGF